MYASKEIKIAIQGNINLEKDPKILEVQTFIPIFKTKNTTKEQLKYRKTC